MKYEDFLAKKKQLFSYKGKQIENTDIHEKLFYFQRDLVVWAAKKGRAAIFADTGLGKTFMQLEWARTIDEKTLIVAPLTVARQTVRESAKIGIELKYVRHQSECSTKISITNYEMLDEFDGGKFDSVVLDESSILKGLAGATKQRCTEMFGQTKYRLCCTATPAPNDITEIANHAEFLGVMSRTDIMSMFFVHDDEGWRLKGHAKHAFFRWLASWGMFLRMPSDLGYSDDGYILPPLNIERMTVSTNYIPDGKLFATDIGGIGERSKVRRSVIADKIDVAIKAINDGNQWIVWCGLNDEANILAKAISDSVNVQGSDDAEDKQSAIEAFQDGEIRVLITKSKIGGFGINLQNCHKQMFFGLNDSWETFYQCVRRSYRFGQQYPVDVKVLIADAEQEVLANVMRKDEQANKLRQEMIEVVKGYEKLELNEKKDESTEVETDNVNADEYKLMLGDSSEWMKKIDSNSIGMSIFSPPFISLYAYSPTERDVGNSRNEEEFFEHFDFIIRELLRITKPGRLACVHVSQVPAMLVRDGYIGLKDFRGKTIVRFEDAGWIYNGEVCIDKNPQAQAIRTHSKALLFAQLKKDSSWLRPALADYVLVFRKEGDNPESIKPQITNDQWVEWAHPVWYNIDETDTLNYREARENDDDRHICPLQLGTIERSILLWSNRGDTVFSPFMGIGSEGYIALKHNRKFIGIELKRSYFDCAVNNIRESVKERDAGSLFAL